MSAELDTIEESIKIALDAADAATDITSEYNKVKREHKKLEAKVKQIHRYTTIIFGSSILASVVAVTVGMLSKNIIATIITGLAAYWFLIFF